MLVVHSYMVPIVYTSHLDNKRYVIADSNWTEVADDFEWKDIKWFQKPYKGGKNEAFKIEMDFDVAGSKGKTYKVKLYHNTWSCSCPAFGWSGNARTCKHITSVKKENGW